MPVPPGLDACVGASPVERRMLMRYESPIGPIYLAVTSGKLVHVRLGGKHPGAGSALRSHAGAFLQALEGYFRGEPIDVAARDLDLSDVTPFRRRVYMELLKTPFGELTSYGDLAKRVGVGGGARAVGQAMAANPVPLFVPCHRVVTSGRRLGGFGAGLRWKKRLLMHEGWILREDRLCRPKLNPAV
jgi:methylated-DNA-[protein]-cysteine S-methyltransferase